MYYEQRFFSYYLVIMYFCVPHYCELAPPFTLIRASAHSLLRFSTAADKSEWFLWFWATQESPSQSHIFKTMYVAAKEKYERKITSGNKTNWYKCGRLQKNHSAITTNQWKASHMQWLQSWAADFPRLRFDISGEGPQICPWCCYSNPV